MGHYFLDSHYQEIYRWIVLETIIAILNIAGPIERQVYRLFIDG